ncbi:MAG TPA: pentapeptide repeat-containing protein [Flavobacterium sp.]
MYFNDCSIKDVNFAMCDPFIFEIHFKNCTLDFSKFYTLKIKGATFTHCSLVAVDFMSADLTAVHFDNCDLYRTEFNKAVANSANFKTSLIIRLTPGKLNLKEQCFP